MATSIFKQNFPGTTALQAAADTADFIVGLDLHKKTTAICIVDRRSPTAPIFQRKRLMNNELLAVLERFPGKKVVACEAAYGWFLLRDALRGVSTVTFVPLDARKTAAWVKTSGVKNDAIDAQVLCYACLHGGIGRLAVHVPTRDAHERYKLVRHRDNLVRSAASIKRQLRACEREYGPNPYTGEIPSQSAIARAMEADLRNTLTAAEQTIDAVEVRMRQISAGDVIVARLRSIPGIGFITAFALRWKIETIDRFEDRSHLCSYIGFGIRERQSGDATTKGKIAKTGDELLRRLLIQGAQAIRSHCPSLVPLYLPTLGQPERMTDPRHVNKVVTALARKNLALAFCMWKHETTFDLERYRQQRSGMVACVDAREREHAQVSPPGHTTCPPRSPSPSPSPSLCPPSTAAELVSGLAR